MHDLLLYDARILSCESKKNLTVNNSTNNYITIKNKKITSIGHINHKDIADRKKLSDLIAQSKNSINLDNKWMTPGLIDCHTHLVFAGDRQHEFTLRLNGVSYEQIAKQGGGINFTVKKTRQASFQELLNLAENRLKQMLDNGVTTVEIKSGYGLDLETEKKILLVADSLAKNYPVTIQKTFLGAHTLPIEYKNKPEEYINYLIKIVLPDLVKSGLVDAVDGFCEKIAFTAEQLKPLYKKAKEYDLKIKGHTEQLSNIGGANLVAEFNGLSCDHLEYANLDTVKVLKKNNITAVLLPGAYYYLNEKQQPPIVMLREYSVPLAIATDFNPGTSPNISLLTVMNMACVLYKLTPEEAWLGVTINAAKALGLDHFVGSLEVGKQADIVVWDFDHPNDVCYYLGYNWKKTVIKNGQIVKIDS